MTGKKLICVPLVAILAVLVWGWALDVRAGEVPGHAPNAVHKHLPAQHLAKAPGRPLGRLVLGFVQRAMDLRDDLSLTVEQRVKLLQIAHNHRGEVLQQAKALWQKRNVLRDAVLAEHSQEAAIRKAADDLGKQIGDAAVLAAKIRGEVGPVLSTEQRGRIKHFISDNDKAVAQFFHAASARLEHQAENK